MQFNWCCMSFWKHHENSHAQGSAELQLFENLPGSVMKLALEPFGALLGPVTLLQWLNSWIHCGAYVACKKGHFIAGTFSKNALTIHCTLVQPLNPWPQKRTGAWPINSTTILYRLWMMFNGLCLYNDVHRLSRKKHKKKMMRLAFQISQPHNCDRGSAKHNFWALRVHNSHNTWAWGQNDGRSVQTLSN